MMLHLFELGSPARADEKLTAFLEPEFVTRFS